MFISPRFVTAVAIKEDWHSSRIGAMAMKSGMRPGARNAARRRRCMVVEADRISRLSAMMLQRVLLGFLFASLAGCAGPQHVEGLTRQRIEVAFSPEAGAEALVVKVITAARTSIRLAGYSFTSPV